MKERESIQKSELKPKTSFKDINEFHDFLDKQREGARLAAIEMSKRPVSLEEMREQYLRIHGN